MNIRKGPTIFLIVIVLILMALGVYVNRPLIRHMLGGSDRSSRAKQSRQVENVRPNPDLPPSGSNPPAQDPPKIESNDGLKDYDPINTLSRREYGRPNPFTPLVQARPGPKPEPGPEPDDKEAPGPLMQVTAIFGGQAIVKVDGASKTVSAGNTLAGMRVVSTGESEVILKKGDKNYTLTLGEEPKHVPPGEGE